MTATVLHLFSSTTNHLHVRMLRFILSMHVSLDELIVECLQENAEAVAGILRSSMTQAVKLEVCVRTLRRQELFLKENHSHCYFVVRCV